MRSLNNSRDTCARGGGIHGDVLNVHTEAFLKPNTGGQGVTVSSAYQNLPTHGYHVLQRFNEETFGSFPFSSVRIDREQHVPDSSNHSLSLIKLFSFSCPEGNKRLVLFSKQNERSERQYRPEPPPAFVHHLSSPDTLCLTQTTFKITEHIHILVHIKIHIHLRIRSHIPLNTSLCARSKRPRECRHHGMCFNMCTTHNTEHASQFSTYQNLPT